MPKNFSFNDVNKTLAFYKKVFKDEEAILSYPQKLKEAIQSRIKYLKSSKIVEKNLSAQLEGEVYNDKNEIASLWREIFCYIEGQAICEDITQEGQDYKNEIIAALKIIKGTNPVSWIFLSSRAKQGVIEKLNYLEEHEQSPYVQDISNALTRINQLKDTDLALVQVDFNKRKMAYQSVLNTIDPTVWSADHAVDSVNNLNKRFNDINTKIDELMGYLNNDIYNIKEAVKVLVDTALNKQLKEIDLDEINKDKKGLRVKTLKEAGFSNYGDIQQAKVEDLAAINGVSREGAITIKKAIEASANKLNKNIKIKVSYDDQNKDSTALVLNLYKYVKDKESFEPLNSRIALGKDIKVLVNLKDGFGWFFLEKDKQDNIYQIYQTASLDIENLKPLYKEAKKDIESTFKANKKIAWEYFRDNSIACFNALEELCPGVLGNDDNVYGLPEDLALEVDQQVVYKDGLHCSLRRYQEWGVKYILHQEKVLLGDEMGLGKTIQAIASMVSLSCTGATQFLVICPASVVPNWCREVSKHSVLTPYKIHGSSKNSNIEHWLKQGGVAITTFETLASLELGDDIKIDEIVVDEAHYIKNPAAQRTINTKMMCRHSDRILFMTGTALENNVEEMINLISMLQPKIARAASSMLSLSSAPAFREKIVPVYYRRKREDVLTELPEKIESEEWLDMGQEEENVYENATLKKKFTDMRQVSWNVKDMEKSCKALRLKEIVEEAQSEGRKILVFSFFLETLKSIYHYLPEYCLTPITGSMSPNQRQRLIDDFDKADPGTVLLAQIQSGGTGLNIQAASVVVICEPQLKPSVENQAIARAYRMGQARNVLVYRLLCENTVDERMLNIVKNKQDIFNAFADKALAAETEINQSKMDDIIQEEIDRINQKKGQEKPNSPNYEDLLTYDYQRLVNYFNKKYGPVSGDYFEDKDCLKFNTSILKDDLFIHHIDEEKGILLETPEEAIKYPYEYQKSSRLVYCDGLEHILLHIKMMEANHDNSITDNLFELALSFIKELNSYYINHEIVDNTHKNQLLKIQDNYKSYIKILKHLNEVIKSQGTLNDTYGAETLAYDSHDKLCAKILKDILK